MLESYRVPRIKVPTWPELSVAKLLPTVMADPVLKPYFPDKYGAGKVPDRNYFWGVISAVKPGYFKALINEALEQRNKVAVLDLQKPEKTLAIKSEVLAKMLDAPYWLGKHHYVNFFLGKKRSGRSMVFSKAAPKTITKKREYTVTATPQSFAAT